jgi:hypothetical protein
MTGAGSAVSIFWGSLTLDMSVLWAQRLRADSRHIWLRTLVADVLKGLSLE